MLTMRLLACVTIRYIGFLMTNITQIWDLFDVLTRVRVAFAMKSFITNATTCALLYLIPFPKIRTSELIEMAPSVHHHLFS
jgi:hypothetical protein